MKDSDIFIVGAGFSGLICATQMPKARIIEKRKEPTSIHHALLRFRSESVGRAIQIPFRKVTVRKGIWHENKLHSQCNIRMANQYSQKVICRLADRSIWSLDSVERYVAPNDLYHLLVEKIGNRISWDTEWTWGSKTDFVSTAPMPDTLELLGISTQEVFSYSSIDVHKTRIPDCDVHQTIYYPCPTMRTYRASITGNELMVESAGSIIDIAELRVVLQSFGISSNIEVLWEKQSQRYGKIVPISERARRSIILKMSLHYNVHSLGRFATWRNILLDDLLNDIEKVKSIINNGLYDAIKGN